MEFLLQTPIATTIARNSPLYFRTFIFSTACCRRKQAETKWPGNICPGFN